MSRCSIFFHLQVPRGVADGHRDARRWLRTRRVRLPFPRGLPDKLASQGLRSTGVDPVDELNERDNEEQTPWPPPERRIHTQPYDFSINTLLEQWSDETLLIPEFQREYVWDDSKASRLIESLLLNIPIPVLYFSETADAKYQIVDGHQRVRSVVRFVNNEFALRGLRIQEEFRGAKFYQLPQREQRFLKSRTMRAIVLTEDSHPDMKFEVFERLNTGSVILNAQEIRRAIYRGSVTLMLDDLVLDSNFRQAIGRKSPRPRFVDHELVLRYLALQSSLREYRPPLVRFLNEYLRTANTLPAERLAAPEDAFHRSAQLCYRVFGEASYRLLDRSGSALERNINRALFETQMLVLACAEPNDVISDARTVRRVMARLCQESKFLDAIQRATGDRIRTFSRILSFADALDREGISIDYGTLGLPREN